MAVNSLGRQWLWYDVIRQLHTYDFQTIKFYGFTPEGFMKLDVDGCSLFLEYERESHCRLYMYYLENKLVSAFSWILEAPVTAGYEMYAKEYDRDIAIIEFEFIRPKQRIRELRQQAYTGIIHNLREGLS